MELDYRRVCKKAMSTLRGEAIRRHLDAEELASIGYVALAEVRPETEALAVIVARRAMLMAFRERMKLESKRVWTNDPAESDDGDPVDPTETLLSTGGGKLQLEMRHTDLWEAMKALPAREYQIVTLHFWGGKSQAAIADELGINQATVSRTLDSAKKILASCIKEQFSATSIVGAENNETHRTVPSGRTEAA